MKKVRLIITMIFVGLFFCVAGCTEQSGRYVTEIKQDGNSVTIYYSDGTDEKIEVNATKGEKGEPGEKGEDGESAEAIEFRYYRGSLWWKYLSSTVWNELVTSDELNATDLAVEEFKLSVYAASDDLSVLINSSLYVNGNYSEYQIKGNTLTFSVDDNDSKKYYDITKINNEFEMISYVESGVDEQKVSFVNNKDAALFNGVYTYKTSDNESYKVVVNATEYNTSVNATFGEVSCYCQAYMKGEVLYAKQSFGGDAIITLTEKVTGYEATLALTDGTVKDITSVVKWVDISNFAAGYTIDIDSDRQVDVVIKSATMVDLYTSATKCEYYYSDSIVQNETSVTLTALDNTKYEFIWDDDENAVMVKVNDVIKPYTNWIDANLFVGNATFVTDDQSVLFTIKVTVSAWGTYFSASSTLSDCWFNITQYRNSLYIKASYSSDEKVETYVLTLNSDGSFSGTYNGTECSVKREYTMADFVGSYQCQKNLDSGVLSFEVKYNSLGKKYYLEFMGNETSYEIVENKLVFKNNRAGIQYELIKNSDGTYSFQEKNYEVEGSDYVKYEFVTRTDN